MLSKKYFVFQKNSAPPLRGSAAVPPPHLKMKNCLTFEAFETFYNLHHGSAVVDAQGFVIAGSWFKVLLRKFVFGGEMLMELFFKYGPNPLFVYFHFFQVTNIPPI